MTTIAIGAAAPPFDLPDTDGARHALGGDGERRRARDRRRLHLQPLPVRARVARPLLGGRRDYADRGRADAASSTPTTPSATRATPSRRCSERVRADGGWPAPYLRDEDQSVAPGLRRAHDARRVRHRPRRRGRLPRRARRRPRRSRPGRRLAARGARRRARGPAGRPRETKPVGCSIKWKP
jgi:hypothetical protein